jgi:hypothetical protein
MCARTKEGRTTPPTDGSNYDARTKCTDDDEKRRFKFDCPRTKCTDDEYLGAGAQI